MCRWNRCWVWWHVKPFFSSNKRNGDDSPFLFHSNMSTIASRTFGNTKARNASIMLHRATGLTVQTRLWGSHMSVIPEMFCHHMVFRGESYVHSEKQVWDQGNIREIEWFLFSLHYHYVYPRLIHQRAPCMLRHLKIRVELWFFQVRTAVVSRMKGSVKEHFANTATTWAKKPEPKKRAF